MDFDTVIRQLDAGISTAARLVDLVLSIRPGIFGGKKPQEADAAAQGITEIKQALLDAKNALLSVQEAEYEVKKKISELERRLGERESLTLQPLGPGAFAYAVQAAEGAIAQPPWYCQPCFDGGHRAVFQFAKREFRFDTHTCPLCRAEIKIANGLEPQVRVGRVRSPYLGFSLDD